MNETAIPSVRLSNANRGFSGVVMLSLVLHVSIIGGIALAQLSKPHLDLKNAIPVQLVQLGKRRDPKLLPRKVEEPKAETPPEEQAVAIQDKQPDKAAPKPDKKVPKHLSDAAKRLLEGKTDSKLESAVNKIEDREGDPEGDIHGTTTDATNAASGYNKSVMIALQRAYQLPETIPQSQRGFLQAEVALSIDRDGSIAHYEFVKRHPNEIFMAALESLLKTMKLPPPPAALADSVKNPGILVRFRP
jgi:outer membrane biosynthesis protein TonB